MSLTSVFQPCIQGLITESPCILTAVPQLRIQAWMSFSVLVVVALVVYALAVVVSDGTTHVHFSRYECMLVVFLGSFNVSLV